MADVASPETSRKHGALVLVPRACGGSSGTGWRSPAW